MVSTAGLSLEQAPPLHLPLRLFLTAPWFTVAAGLVLIAQGDAVFASRWTPAALAVTHLLTIGFIAQVMCGALLQMLPVIAGSPVPGVTLVASLTHALLTLGSGLLAWGFLGGHVGVLGLGALSSALGFATFLIGAALALARARGSFGTRWALRLGALSLAATVALGSAMVGVLLGWYLLPRFPEWVSAHVAWGLIGWVGLVIVGVGYQVLPLFYVTPEYPSWMRRLLAPAILASLLVGSLLPVLGMERLALWMFGLAGAGFGAFAIASLDRQRRRARPRADATLLHWWAAMASLLAALVAWSLQAAPELTGVLLLVGVGVGLPSGMLLKIVPFLCWFHLQARQVAAGSFAVRVPHLQKLLPDRLARWHLALYLIALVLLTASVRWPMLAPAAGIALAGSGLWLAAVLATTARQFARVARELG